MPRSPSEPNAILNVQIHGVPVATKHNWDEFVWTKSYTPFVPDGKTLNLGLLIRDVSSYKWRRSAHFSSLWTQDFNTVLSAIAGSFNVALDECCQRLIPASPGSRRRCNPSEKSAQLISNCDPRRQRWSSPDRPWNNRVLQLIADGKSSHKDGKL